MELDSRFFELAEQLGYRKVRKGQWIEELVDDGQGFPHTEYTCPTCGKKSDHKANFCEDCGTDLRSKK